MKTFVVYLTKDRIMVVEDHSIVWAMEKIHNKYHSSEIIGIMDVTTSHVIS